MASHNELGKEGEELAVKWLTEKGYTILQRNWRHSHYELDIVAKKNNTANPSGRAEVLHFIEVKARKSYYYGNPEDSVTKKKFKHLQKAADEYLQLNPGHKWIQYDILSIVLQHNGKPDYFLLEDVYL
jgi:putative endonuclease